jgi:hypothetical protein
MKTPKFLIALAIFTAFTLSVRGTNYAGNGATGFGGPVGTGSLDISDTASSLTMTFNRGSGAMNDVLVLYLDTQTGGFTDNSTFSDNGDGGRTAISGANNSNPSRTAVNLPFAADYAIAIQNGFIGVFGLASGGDNSLNYLFGQSQSGNNLDSSYSISMTPAQMAMIGLTPGSGQTFSFVGTLISTSAYRSNETIGNSVTVAGDGSGNAGFNNSQTFSAANSYTLVPEPSAAALAGLCGLFGLIFRRNK